MVEKHRPPVGRFASAPAKRGRVAPYIGCFFGYLGTGLARWRGCRRPDALAQISARKKNSQNCRRTETDFLHGLPPCPSRIQSVGRILRLSTEGNSGAVRGRPFGELITSLDKSGICSACDNFRAWPRAGLRSAAMEGFTRNGRSGLNNSARLRPDWPGLSRG